MQAHRQAAVLWLLSLTGCAADEALRAGVNTAIAVGATAAHVAATNGCWGDCAYGTHCDAASAMCVPDREDKVPRATDPASASLQAPPVPAPQGREPTGICEVSGGACVDEGAVCTLAHDECVGQCRCLGLSWQCLESCR